MAIQDPDAERRNLVVTSIAFVAYYLGEGKINSDVLKLPLINIHFHNINALIVMVWLSLFWFLYRYWLTHRELFHRGIGSELSALKTDTLVRKYFEKQTGILLLPLGSLSQDELPLLYAKASPRGEITHLIYNTSEQKYQLSYIVTVLKNPKTNLIRSNEIRKIRLDHKNPTTGSTSSSHAIYFEGIRGKLTFYYCFIRCAITQPSFSSYVVPYLLCLTAVSLGADDLLQIVSLLFFDNQILIPPKLF